jgi:hypothetical protein
MKLSYREGVPQDRTADVAGAHTTAIQGELFSVDSVNGTFHTASKIQSRRREKRAHRRLAIVERKESNQQSAPERVVVPFCSPVSDGRAEIEHLGTQPIKMTEAEERTINRWFYWLTHPDERLRAFAVDTLSAVSDFTVPLALSELLLRVSIEENSDGR